MKPFFRITSCCALVALAACGDRSPAPPLPPTGIDAGLPVEIKRSVGQLESPQGAVTLDRGGAKRAAKVERLFEGDIIETGEDGTAVLRFANGRIVELGSDGRFEVEVDGSGVMLNVAKGLVLTRVKASQVDADDSVLVTLSSPLGLTRIGAAELSMKVDDSSVSVDVTTGEIELVSRSGGVTKVLEGKRGVLRTVRQLPEISMSIIASSGVAELKEKDAKRFVTINNKKLPELNPGDVVRVKDGRISLAPQGSSTRLALLKGSEVGIGATGKGAKEEAIALDVKKGELEVFAPRAQSTRIEAGGLTLVSDLGGQYLLRRTGSGFDLEALTGDVTIERQGASATVVPGGQSASIPLNGEAVVRAAIRESVVLPSRNGLRVYHQSLKRVSLTWDDAEAEGATWRVQLASDSSFSTVIRDGVVHDNFISVPIPPKGVWYWRVWKGDVEHAKGSAVFSKEPRAQELSRLKNVVVDGAETTTIFFQDKDKPPVVTFTWTKDDAASKYVVKVYEEGQLSTPVAERTVSETQMSLPENSLDEGKYLWSLTPLDVKGSELKGGRMNRLHMVFDNAVETLSIKSPREGDLAGKTVRATGVAPVGSRLFINGKSIGLDEQARFDVAVSPLPGGRVVFRLLNDGAEVYTVRTVRSR